MVVSPTVTSPQIMQSAMTRVPQLVFDNLEAMGLAPKANQKIADCIDANTQGGNLLRGRTVIDTAWILRGHSLSPAEADDLGKLGSLVELLNAAYLIWDDIMDGSSTRRGKPCWYRRESIGMDAVNDGCLLRSSIYVIIKNGFRDHPSYLELTELFAEACLQTELGQHCDALASTGSLEEFIWKQYGFITAKKTAYYTMYLPLTIPLFYLGLATPERLAEIYDISMKMGYVFQARDDFLDVYGDPNVTGKIGTDIQDHKCAWPAIEAMARCDDNQRMVLIENYGKKDPVNVLKVKAIFDEINLPQLFGDWDAKMVAELGPMTEKITDAVVRESVMAFMSKYFKDTLRHLPSTSGKLEWC
ncbi:uncharacterized protein N7483_007393 [Penicillium malachiteum]|uniref:uncharacterized protein n=1 Tax=Penicillium malachiteum TaxID=1324776 RepID=UPI0025492FE6|nr:uncharacterized protein N7483_007393 [Penicillium malachiteum]KAJ5726036.1 hypothetical protein N7483_007393 [Penicillium malachiteum]